MPKERDPFRKYVDDLENRKWRCKFCGIVFAGSTPRIRAHLAGIPGHGIKACEKVKDSVRAEALETINGEGSGLYNSTGGTTGEGMRGTEAQNSNQLGCMLQQGCLPPDDRPLDNLDTSQPSSLLYLSETPAQPDLATHVEFEGDVLPAPLLNNITPTWIFPDSDEEDPGSAEQFANEVLLDSLLGTAPARPQDQESLSPHDRPRDNLDDIQQSDPSNRRLDAAHGNENASSIQQLPMNSLASFCLDFSELQALLELPTHLESKTEEQNARGLSSSPNDEVHCSSMSVREYLSLDELIADGITPDSLLHPTSWSNLDHSLLENLPESREAIVNTFEEIQTNELYNPTVRSSLQIDSSLNVDGANHLQDCGPPRGVEEVPVPSNRSLTNIVQQSGQLPPRCDKEDGNYIRRFPSPAQMEIDPSSESLHTSDSHISEATIVDSLVVEASIVPSSSHALVPPSSSRAPHNAPPPPQFLPYGTGVIGPSSLPELDTNEDAPMTSHPNTRNNFEENRALKRKLGEVHKLLEHVMVGEAFKKNATKILEYLVGNQISRLGICGMGGVGKTAIMVHVHNRLLEEANYGDVLWITVSQDFKTRKLQDTIWEALDLGKLQENDVRKRAAMLCDRLTKRGKFTIILDDVWKYIDLTKVGIPVEVDGIKLVLTTRFFDICRQMQCQMIKIEPLFDIEAKSLFLKNLQSEVALNLEAEAVVMSVIKECAGLPLAIITIARSMRGVTNVFEWKDCLEKLKESEMGQTDMEKVLKKLKFSYNRLGDHEDQQCFLSCALYPEDQLIYKFQLIEFFIDQGLIGQLNTREKQYDRGLTILQKLVNACLLEDHEGNVKMHDLIRDMALQVMSVTSIVKAGKGLRRIPSEEYWTEALEKVSLMENDIEEFPLNMSPYCPKLSTLLLNKSLSFTLVIPDSFFKHLWGLKILNLSECALEELPDSISDLVNLTALLLRGCYQLCRIPHLRKLRSLRKLDILKCVRVEALEGLDMLVNLRYLDITDTRLPKGTLGALLNLQCLRAELVNGEEITKLRALETLQCFFDDVDDFNKFVSVLSKRGNNPRYYNIMMDPRGFTNFCYIGVGGQFQDCVRRVTIMTRSHAIVSARGESSGSGSGICILIPQDVRELVAHNCDGVTNLFDIGLLEKLEVLKIGYWSNLRVLCEGQGEEVIDIHDSPTRTPTPVLLRSLRNLSIHDCPKLKYLFGHETKFSLPHLRRISIAYCEEIVGITMVATSPPPYPPPAFPNLEDIHVMGGCHKMKRVLESEWLPHFPNLRRIEVQYCGVEEIIGGLSSCMSVEEISPERLLVKGCHELPLHPRNLETIQVIGCEGMPEMISGAGQGQEGSMTTLVNNTPSSSRSSISLPKLNTLCLEYLLQLKSICEVPITCSSMRHLEVTDCPKLNRIPLKLQLGDIEDLPYIEVEDEEKWKTLIWDHPDAQAILQSHLLFRGNYCILKGKGWRNSQWYDGEDE